MKHIKTKNILAVIIAVLPINIIMIYYRLENTKAFTMIDMIIYPLLFGVPVIIVILILNKYFLRYSFKTTFNSKDGTWYRDLLYAFILILIYFGTFFIGNFIETAFSTTNNRASTEVIDAIRELAKSPLMMFVWFGPVLWIGVALFEELSRIFFMKCLWNVWDSPNIQLLVIVFVSIVIGLTHLYQGPYGVVQIAFKSIISGLFFYKYRRIYPLIIAHGLYDGLQFLFAIIQINGM